ncbi:four helix bundle protein [Aquiflexum balticum DSM 16537]|jgi:four helix bundle protein|uniref:Four helix bundle protein n=1 Tax=Aquiflexum balticum DSM 16537 TaxID=758820 RepID=A0A1W2GZ25_9BACT|nr:four helix bundle protein [Aquiflexum balticum]SMD41869.1 four helix bundle protein [Aquiflexum balticum DSM 16537]
MHRYKELKVWQKAIDLAVEVYRITEKLPKDERFGLIGQMNRSAVSIPSNIAEGAGRNTDKDFNNFLGVALGSSFELDTQLVISNKLEYVNDQDFQKTEKELEHLQNMIVKLKISLNSK